MADLAALIRWIITYAVTGGFWHFVAVYLIVVAITRISTLVRFSTRTPSTKRAAKTKAEA